ncbi:MAG: amino acid permease [Ignavibacteria bacterium]|nr:amino acid permease [Ignavibacteria bacterium]
MSSPEFKRDLKLLDATMIVVGSMIGSGIFIVSADIARSVGGGGMLLLVWAITGLVTLIAALSYGELAGMMPKAGGQYVYLREAYNPFVGFLYGWTLFMVIQTGTIAAVGVAFAKYTGVLLPGYSEKNILVQLGSFSISAAQLLAIVSIAFLTWLNIRGVRAGKIVQNVFTSTKIIALFGLILLGIIVGANATAWNANFTDFWTVDLSKWDSLALIPSGTPMTFAIIAAIGTAMVGSLFSSDAWNNITFTAGEVVNPKRTIPLSLALGTGIVTLLYILANIAYLLVLPVVGNAAATDVVGRGIQFATTDRVGAAAAEVIFGDGGAKIMAVLIMVSTFGCNNGLILSGARVYFAMAKDGLFFKKTGELNVNSVPAAALIFQGVWASILCLSGTYGDLLDYVVTAVLIFYILTIAGIFILRKKQPNAERPYKAFGYPVLPALYILIATAIIIDLLLLKPEMTMRGIAIILTGIPVYFIWKRKG